MSRNRYLKINKKHNRFWSENKKETSFHTETSLSTLFTKSHYLKNSIVIINDINMSVIFAFPSSILFRMT